MCLLPPTAGCLCGLGRVASREFADEHLWGDPPVGECIHLVRTGPAEELALGLEGPGQAEGQQLALRGPLSLDFKQEMCSESCYMSELGLAGTPALHIHVSS